MQINNFEKTTRFLWILMDLKLIPAVPESSTIWMIFLQEVWKYEIKDSDDIEDYWI